MRPTTLNLWEASREGLKKMVIYVIKTTYLQLLHYTLAITSIYYILLKNSSSSSSSKYAAKALLCDPWMHNALHVAVATATAINIASTTATIITTTIYAQMQVHAFCYLVRLTFNNLVVGLPL